MPRRKPKVDEFRMNLMFIERLMGKYRRIGVFALAGEGKTTLINRLREKFAGTEWYFYDMMEDIVNDPFVYAFISADIPDLPEFDVIFCHTYTDDYKEAVTGVTFNDGQWHPMEDYAKAAERKEMGRLHAEGKLQGKYVKSMDALKKLLRGEEIEDEL